MDLKAFGDVATSMANRIADRDSRMLLLSAPGAKAEGEDSEIRVSAEAAQALFSDCERLADRLIGHTAQIARETGESNLSKCLQLVISTKFDRHIQGLEGQ